MHTTSLLLSNLHCPSCVSSIEDALYTLAPKPSSVSSSIVSSWVTVRHEPLLSSVAIRNALEDAGFNIHSVVTDGLKRDPHPGSKEESRKVEHVRPGGLGFLDAAFKEWTSDLGNRGSDKRHIARQRHVDVCVLCQAEESKCDGEKKPSSTSDNVTQASQEHKMAPEIEKYEDASISEGNSIYFDVENDNDADIENTDLSFVVIDDGSPGDLWCASIAVGGMTCVSCVNTIKGELEQVDWIKKIDINLIMNSAKVEFTGKDHSEELLDMIESIGFEAALDSVVDVGGPQASSRQRRQLGPEGGQMSPQRSVEIKIGGMFCPRCPERILAYMNTLAEKKVKVERRLTLTDPIIKISYTPQAPDFTIRHIISGLTATDQKWEASIYHPPTLEERSRILHAQERRWILRRVILCIAVAIPTFIIGIVMMSLVPSSNPARQYLEGSLSAGVSRTQWALFILATPVYLFAADVFHIRALKEIRATWRRGSKVPLLQRFYRFGSMDMLISLGTSIAYISSVAQLVAAGVHPPMNTNDNSFYFDSVVFLTLFLLIGRLIEAYSKSRTGDAVAMLGKLRPRTAFLIDTINTFEYEVNVDLLEFGDFVKVLHGASPPSDGVIVEGEAAFDESSLTGESRAVKKVVGDEVYTGTVNKGSPIKIKITGAAGTSMIDQIIEAVREGQTRHAPIERIADTLTSYFVPLITLIAISTWVIWLGLGLSGSLPVGYMDSETGNWASWSLQFAIAVFVVACPCGLGLAAPTALFVGSGLAAQHGILVKGGGEAFEKASRLDCVVFDKTGTLTVGGEPAVTNYEAFPWGEDSLSTHDEMDILAKVKSLEDNSGHPIAKAIVSFCKTRDLEGRTVKDAAEIAGKGMKGVYISEGRGERIEMIVGNEALLKDHNVEVPDDMSAKLHTWKREGKSIAFVATSSPTVKDSWHIAAVFGVSDDIRPEAFEIVKALRLRGTAVWMLSGDNYDSACAIGAQVGIAPENVIAGVLPSEKADKIRYLQKSLGVRRGYGKESTQSRALVAMVGDGINDSPALTAADVGIAIGSGSDIAISSAEFVLVSSDLNALITLLDLSKMVFNRIKFNFGWALVYNLIGVPVAAGALYWVVSNGSHVRLDPVWASLAMAMSSISVVCSSLALRSGIPGVGFRSRKR